MFRLESDYGHFDKKCFIGLLGVGSIQVTTPDAVGLLWDHVDIVIVEDFISDFLLSVACQSFTKLSCSIVALFNMCLRFQLALQYSLCII